MTEFKILRAGKKWLVLKKTPSILDASYAVCDTRAKARRELKRAKARGRK